MSFENMHVDVGQLSSLNIPEYPEHIPAQWLDSSRHPLLVCSQGELEQARQAMQSMDWMRAYLEKQKALTAPLMKKSIEELEALVPSPGGPIVHGQYGMNMDPEQGQCMRWKGWDDPFRMYDVKDVPYPNDKWPDSGDGVSDESGSRRFFFRAQAYGQILRKLDEQVLPALADVFALAQSMRHAQVAAALFDALASVYPINRRGPLDYPIAKGDEHRGGRLQRPYYQVARGLMNYTRALDLLAPSGVLEAPSRFARGCSIREHVIRNMLWNGAAYCLDFAREWGQLHNGHADYVRGAAAVGVLLQESAFVRPLLCGPTSVYAMLANNIDRNGFYYETATLYENHARVLYVTMAELIEAIRRNGMARPKSLYIEKGVSEFFREPFNRREVGGRLPLIGDSGPDMSSGDPREGRRAEDGARHDDASWSLYRDQEWFAWIQFVRGTNKVARDAAADLLAAIYHGRRITPPVNEWTVYHVNEHHVQDIASRPVNPARLYKPSCFLGAKGLALLRSGMGARRRGAQLLFGPMTNHGQCEALTWTFYARGAEWSFDPGYFNSHYRFGWTKQSVAHLAMTVDQRSYDPRSGGAHLISWQDAHDVQWAMARHPDAYREQGVTRFERLIAQVGDRNNSGYWLDIGRVSGGTVRDDSFHTQMALVQLDKSMAPIADSSFGGGCDWGRRVRDDGRLAGSEEKAFYWQPEGHGYSFLGLARQGMMEGGLRAVFTSPAVTPEIKATLVVDMAGAPGRQLFVAQSPRGPGVPEVPYLIQRDRGAGQSIFAKIIRLVDDLTDDSIRAFTQVTAVCPGRETMGCAFAVEFDSGACDLWIVGDTDASTRLAQNGLPEIETDAQVACVRFDTNSEVEAVYATGATTLKIGDRCWRSAGHLCGKVVEVRTDGHEVVIVPDWKESPCVPSEAGSMLLSFPPHGQPSTWCVRTVEENRIVLADSKATMGDTVLYEEPAKGRGWYRMHPPISRFYGAGGVAMEAAAEGKSIWDGKNMLGRVSALDTTGQLLQIKSDAGIPVEGLDGRKITVFEISPGDELKVPLIGSIRESRA